MWDRFKTWLASDSANRVWRTLKQVFGGAVAMFVISVLTDWGMDGQVMIRDHIFGDAGLIIACTTALALWMNRKAN